MVEVFLVHTRSPGLKKMADDGFAKKYKIMAFKNYLRHTGHSLSLSGVHLGRSVLGGNHLDVK